MINQNEKWYESENVDNTPYISSRIRLARNVSGYLFPDYINDIDALSLQETVKKSIINDRVSIGSEFEHIKLSETDKSNIFRLIDKHCISNLLARKSKQSGVVLNKSENISLMVNEEDHIRIQSIMAGNNIDYAWDIANKVDDLVEESVDYAFHDKFGYLTACPTNSGTGLRASFMLHLPGLEKTGKLSSLVQAVSKFGISVRGTHGEGTEPLGSIYQISNQITMGKSEENIIEGLKNITNQIVEQETRTMSNLIKDLGIELEDKIYRAYGILTNSRKITFNEAVDMLSYVRIGYLYKILGADKPQKTMYNIIMNIQPTSLSYLANNNYFKLSDSGKKDLNIARADYLRETFNK